jgi:hypothetical protein
MVLAGGGRGASHGSASPFDMRNSLFAWGPHFQRGLRSEVPAGIVDVAPTTRHLLGLPGVPADGRLLHELLAGSATPSAVNVRRETHEAHASWPGGGYRQRLYRACVGHTSYLEHVEVRRP